MRVILYAKYEKADIHKITETQYQYLTMTQHNDLLKLLQRLQEFLDGTLGNWKTDPVDFELKQDAKPICLRPYPVPKVYDNFFKN